MKIVDCWLLKLLGIRACLIKTKTNKVIIDVIKINKCPVTNNSLILVLFLLVKNFGSKIDKPLFTPKSEISKNLSV